MSIDLDRLLESGAKVVDSAKKTASDLAKQGKRQADLLAAQSKLARSQRQLGILVYNLARNGEENPLLVKKYIASIATIEAEIEDLKGEAACQYEQAAPEKHQKATYVYEAPQTKTCPQCGAEMEEDAMFCSGCGAQL